MKVFKIDGQNLIESDRWKLRMLRAKAGLPKDIGYVALFRHYYPKNGIEDWSLRNVWGLKVVIPEVIESFEAISENLKQ
jgi:hypothetical protein